jgi:PEP-CTERM motif
MLNRAAFIVGVATSVFFATPVFAVVAIPGTFGFEQPFSGQAGDKCSLATSAFGLARTCSSVSIKTTYGTPQISGGNPEELGGPTSLTAADGGENEAAFASAAADFGTLEADGSAQYGPLDDTNGGHGFAFASFIDEMTVLGTQPETVTFTSIVEGGFLGDAVGDSQVRVIDVSDGHEMDLFAEVNQFDPIEAQAKYVTLDPGQTYVIFDELTAAATADSANGAHTDSDKEAADLSDTGILYIDAPAGTLSFLSGHDYSTPSASSVPEPSTWAMTILGFFGLGAMLLRRREAAVALAKPLN